MKKKKKRKEKGGEIEKGKLQTMMCILSCEKEDEQT